MPPSIASNEPRPASVVALSLTTIASLPALPSIAVGPAIVTTRTESLPAPASRYVVPACVLAMVNVSSWEPRNTLTASSSGYVTPVGPIPSPVSDDEVSVPVWPEVTALSSTFSVSTWFASTMFRFGFDRIGSGEVVSPGSRIGAG